MLFNSTEFVPFLLLVLLSHYVLIPARAVRTRKLLLVVASYAFYMSWNPFFGLLLVFSTVLDFTLAQRMEQTERPGVRRALVTASLCGNLGLLGFFKYGGFLSESVYALMGLGPAAPSLRIFQVALPVGISFYTFQTLSHTIDVYRRQ
jgi:alginate O-acetyltransferase complex protein AlgI